MLPLVEAVPSSTRLPTNLIELFAVQKGADWHKRLPLVFRRERKQSLSLRYLDQCRIGDGATCKLKGSWPVCEMQLSGNCFCVLRVALRTDGACEMC